MFRISARSWRQGMVVMLLVGLDLAISIPIMGATYRPFSWMSLAPAGATSLYPVIQNLSFSGGRPNMDIQINLGGNCALQRNVTLGNSNGWVNVASMIATGQVIHLTDTNPVGPQAFYRIKLLP